MPKDIDLRDLKRIAKEEREARIEKNKKNIKFVEVNSSVFTNVMGDDY